MQILRTVKIFCVFCLATVLTIIFSLYTDLKLSAMRAPGAVPRDFIDNAGNSLKKLDSAQQPALRDCSSASFHSVVSDYRDSHRNSTVKVLVTGAAGFIGSHVAEYCQQQLGFHVVGVDDLSGGFLNNTRELTANGGVFVVGNLQDSTFIDNLFGSHGPFDYVYHLAASAAEGLSHIVRHFNNRNNLGASMLLINAAVRQKPQVKAFVFTSSIAAYGSSDGVLPLREESPQRPEDPYGIAKHSAEMDLRAAHHMFGLNFVIFRPHNVYGPRQNTGDKFRNAIGSFMNQILRGENITIFGDGRQRREFSFVDDVAPLISASPIFPRAINQDFFVGVDTHYSILELSSAVQIAMGVESRIIFSDSLPVKFAYASHEKLRCTFNPPHPTDLKSGLARTAQFVKKHGAFPPAGYSENEICEYLPHSWWVWLNLSDSVQRARRCERKANAKRRPTAATAVTATTASKSGWTISSRIPPPPQGRFFYFGITHGNNHEKALAAHQTWGQRASGGVIWYTTSGAQNMFPFIVISHPENNGYKRIFFRVLEIYRHVWQYYPGYDWYIRVWDDNFVVTENVEKFLMTKRSDENVEFGYFRQVPGPQPFPLVWGGPGNFMSQSSLSTIAENVTDCIEFARGLERKYPNHVKDWKWQAEDVFISAFRTDRGSKMVWTDGMYPFAPGPDKEQAVACRSKQKFTVDPDADKYPTEVLTLHYVGPAQMIRLNHLWLSQSCSIKKN
jgi:UDP-glucose 4-epimerase